MGRVHVCVKLARGKKREPIEIVDEIDGQKSLSLFPTSAASNTNLYVI